jgi:hypothetical protein
MGVKEEGFLLVSFSKGFYFGSEEVRDTKVVHIRFHDCSFFTITRGEITYADFDERYFTIREDGILVKYIVGGALVNGQPYSWGEGSEPSIIDFEVVDKCNLNLTIKGNG